MNKDLLVASIFGFSLGLVAAIALWIVPKIIPPKFSLKTPVASVSSQLESKTPLLALSSPTDGSITKDTTITVSGDASSGELVVISTIGENQVVSLGPDGKFSTDVEVNEGGNEIVVTSYNRDGSVDTKTYSQDTVGGNLVDDFRVLTERTPTCLRGE